MKMKRRLKKVAASSEPVESELRKPAEERTAEIEHREAEAGQQTPARLVPLSADFRIERP
jgi:hypothetical protein